MTRRRSASVFIDETQRFSWQSRRRSSRFLLVPSSNSWAEVESARSRRRTDQTEESDDEWLCCRRHFGRNKIVVSFDTRQIGLLEGFRLKGGLSNEESVPRIKDNKDTITFPAYVTYIIHPIDHKSTSQLCPVLITIAPGQYNLESHIRSYIHMPIIKFFYEFICCVPLSFSFVVDFLLRVQNRRFSLSIRRPSRNMLPSFKSRCMTLTPCKYWHPSFM